jgi:hypothetical protein
MLRRGSPHAGLSVSFHVLGMTQTLNIGLKLLLHMRLVRPLLVYRVISFSMFSLRYDFRDRVATIFRDVPQFINPDNKSAASSAIAS